MKKSYSVLPLPLEYRNAFQKADIRGRYPNEINEGLVFAVAYAFNQALATIKTNNKQ